MRERGREGRENREIGKERSIKGAPTDTYMSSW